MDAMRRGWVIGGLLAALAGGCQWGGWRGDRCSDCIPPQTYCPFYKPRCDNFVTQLTAASCADRTLKDVQKHCGKQSVHFQSGFRQAYVDLAMGRPALTPPVPPRGYWTAYYRSCAGQADVAQWFEGYRAGLDYGANSGVSQFNRVATSWSTGGEFATNQALCGPPNLSVSPPPVPHAPAPVMSSPTAGVSGSPMGPYGPLLHPTGYQTPAYAAPPSQQPITRPPVQRIGRMQMDVF
jgi:hypothetical protein